MTATTRPRLHRSRSSVPLARLDLLTFRVHVPAPSAASQQWAYGAPCRVHLEDGVGYRACFWFASRASPGKVWLVVYGYAVPFVLVRAEQVNLAPEGWPDELPPMPEWAKKASCEQQQVP